MKQPNCHPSEENFAKPVRSSMKLSENLMINDCTMREGEQASPVKLDMIQKVRLAENLAKLGLHQIQVGFATSEIDRNAIQEIKKQGLPLKLEAIVQIHQKGWYEPVQAAIDSGADIISMIYPGSELRYKYVEKVTHEEVIQFCQEAVQKLMGKGVTVRFSISDATRGDLTFLKLFSSKVVEAGANRVGLSDTAGAIMPSAMKYLVGEIVKAAPVPIQVHCHNDYGLAVANSLAAAEAGATIVDVTVNGLGERAGNTPLDEFVMALRVFYGVDLGIRTEKLCEISRQVADLLKTPIPPMKPFVGSEAFAHKHSSHTKLFDAYPFTLTSILPEFVGNTSKMGDHG